MIGLDRIIERARPFVSPALADGAAWRGVANVAAQLPASLSSSVYLEAPLERLERPEVGPRLDLIVRIDRATRAIVSRDACPPLEPVLPRGPLWSRVQSLARRWESDPLLDRCGEVMWLEFDVDPAAGAARGVAQPGVFFDFRASAYRGTSCAERRGMIRAALGPLAPVHALRRPIMTLERCLAALPHEAGPASIGILLPRGTSTVRLCILGLGPRKLETYLRDIAWPGSRDALARLRAALDASDDRHAPQLSLLHLDLADDLLPRAGIEYRFDRATQRRGELAERGFLDRLVGAGLCDAPKRDAMLAWPGTSIDTMPHELWPSVATRRVNHVKVMYDETRAPYAKGYLCIRRHGAFRASPPAAARTAASTK